MLNTTTATSPFADSRPISFQELELADPSGEFVQVDVKVASICHSDLSVVSGSRPRPTPIVLGHEASGVVTKIGDDVSQVRVGDRVAFTFQPSCGHCELCRASNGERCSVAQKANVDGTLLNGVTFLSSHGGQIYHHSNVAAFASSAVVHQSSVIAIDDDIPFEIGAVLGCAVTTGAGAIKNAANVGSADRVAIVGAGGVGIAAMLMANARSASVVDIIDPAVGKFELLKSLGAHNVFEPSEAEENYYDVVLEAAGVTRAFESSVKLLRPGGRLVSVGLGHPDANATVNYLDIVFNQKKIIGSYHGSGNIREDMREYQDLWRSGKFPLERLISEEIRLEELNEAMDDLASASELRQIIRFD